MPLGQAGLGVCSCNKAPRVCRGSTGSSPWTTPALQHHQTLIQHLLYARPQDNPNNTRKLEALKTPSMLRDRKELIKATQHRRQAPT